MENKVTFCDPNLIFNFSCTAEVKQGTEVCVSCLGRSIVLNFSPSQSQGASFLFVAPSVDSPLSCSRLLSSGMATLSPKAAFVSTKPEKYRKVDMAIREISGMPGLPSYHVEPFPK